MYYPREAQRDFLFTRATLLFFFMLVLCLMLFLSKDRGAPYALIKAAPIETIGYITQLESLSAWASSTNVYYAFDHEGQRIEGMVNNSSYIDDPGYEVGSPVPVVYSKWFPTVHNIKANLKSSSPNFYIMSASAGLMILCLMLMFWTVHRIYQHKEEDRHYCHPLIPIGLNMTICGIEIKGSEAIIAVASLDNQALTHVALATKKIALEDDDEAANVKAFAAQVKAFVQDNAIERIVIKKRSKKGEFAGGPTTFKIEGVFQLLDGVEVTLLSPQTLNAQNKKHNFDLPTTLNKYQHEAFKAACAALVKK